MTELQAIVIVLAFLTAITLAWIPRPRVRDPLADDLMRERFGGVPSDDAK